MIIKSPSKRVSQLNLKFLELKFLTVKNQKNSNTLPVHNSESLYDEKTYNPDSFMPSLRSSIIKQGKNSRYSLQNTADVTFLNNLNSPNQNNLSQQSIIKYLSTDLNTLYKEFDKNNIRTSNAASKSLAKDSLVDWKIQKCQQHIRSIRKQNQLIHKQIYNMYSQNLNKNQKLKNITSLKLYEDCLNFNQSNKNSDFPQNKQSKRKALIQNSNLRQTIVDQIEKLKDNRQFINRTNKLDLVGYNLMKNQVKKVNDNKTQKKQVRSKNSLTFPRLIDNKYENFYQNLYQHKRHFNSKQDQNNQNSALKQNKNAIEPQSHGQNFAQAKKKLISNNYHKSLQEFLVEKKMRIPEILKSIR